MENDVEDIERLFEDDLNSLDGFNSGDEDDILGSSIALWEEMLQARENEEVAKSEVSNRADGDWSSLMQSVEIQASTWKEMIAIPEVPVVAQSVTSLHQPPPAPQVTDEAVHITDKETCDAISALLQDMLDSVEYLQSMIAERTEVSQARVPSPVVTSIAPPPADFIEEDYITPAPESEDVPDDSIVQTLQTAESLMRQEYKEAIENVSVQPNTDEEYQREVEADRERRRLRKLKREEEMRRAEEYRASVLIQAIARGQAARRRAQRIKQIREQIALHELRKQEEKERREEAERQRLIDQQREEELLLMKQEDELSLLLRKEDRKREQEALALLDIDAQGKVVEIAAVQETSYHSDNHTSAAAVSDVAINGGKTAHSASARSIDNNFSNSDIDLPKLSGKVLRTKQASGWGGVIVRTEDHTPVKQERQCIRDHLPTDAFEESIGHNSETSSDLPSPYELEGYVFDDDSDLIVAASTKPTASIPDAECSASAIFSLYEQRTYSAAALRTLEEIMIDVKKAILINQEDVQLPTLQLPAEYTASSSTPPSCEIDRFPSLLASWQAWKAYASSCISPDSAPLMSTIRSVISDNEQLKERFENIENSACMDMSVEELTDASIVVDMPTVRILEMNVNKIATADDFANCSAQLLALNLKDNVLRHVNGLSSLTSLRILHLDVNQLSDISPLQTLSNLVHLSVSTNRLEFIPTKLSSKLIRFEAYHNRISSITPAALKSMSSLMHLDLGRNKLTEISGIALSQCPLLSHLILSQNQLSALPSPLYLPHLRNLWMSGNKLTDMTSWAPNKRMHPVFLPMLEKIYLQDNLIHRVDPHVFVSSPFLAEIDLSFNNLTSESALVGLHGCNNLYVLQLQENSVNGQSWLFPWIAEHVPSVREISSIAVSYKNEVNPCDSKCTCEMHCIQNNMKAMLHSQMVEQNLARYRDRHQRTQQSSPLEGRDRASKYANSDMLYDCRVLSSKLIEELFEFTGECSYREVILCEPEPSPPPAQSSAESDHPATAKQDTVYSHACVCGISRLQAVFRGRRIRIKLAQLLADAQYSIDDLDDFSGELLELDNMMQNVAELDDDWIYSRPNGEVAYPKAPLVYGDHRRRSSALSRDAKRAFVDEDLEEKSSPPTEDSNSFNSRPASGSSVSSRAHSVASSINHGNITERSSSSNIDDLARDWGLNSDAVLHAMAKRNNRLKRFEKSKERRELDKDPTVRYERFLKTAMSTKGNTQMSGSFGGKPKMSRVPKNKKSVPPAWLSMPAEK